jgi:hypothetical protein
MGLKEAVLENGTVQWGVDLFAKLLIIGGASFTALLWLKQVLGFTMEFSAGFGF